jgi:hypothetical protein
MRRSQITRSGETDRARSRPALPPVARRTSNPLGRSKDPDGARLDLRGERQPTETVKQGRPIDGLDKVVGGAEGHPDFALVDDRDNDDRHIAEPFVGLDLAEDVPAIESGQDHVEDDR